MSTSRASERPLSSPHRLSSANGCSAVDAFCACTPRNLGQSCTTSSPCLPSGSCVADSTQGLKKIIETELHRTYTFGNYARNVAGADGVHADLERLTTAYWPKAGVETGILNNANEHVVAQCDAERQTMVSNFERILDEIRKEAHQIARTYGLEARGRGEAHHGHRRSRGQEPSEGGGPGSINKLGE